MFISVATYETLGGTLELESFAMLVFMLSVGYLVAQRMLASERQLVAVSRELELARKIHARVYGLLVVLATAAVLYVAPRVLPFNPRALGMRQLSDVVTVRLKENDVSTAGRALQYLWQDSGLVVMKDKRTAELVLVNVDHIDVIVLSPPR